jgi:cytochrome c oxidase assembly protein subunit 15
MSDARPENHLRVMRLWLIAAAAMILLTLIVGGATRLTESGLSITEWKPITGVIPPLTHADWQAEFQRYQAIPQYRELNESMDLPQFQVIYWWEWTHRLLARSTGMVFLLPFLFFLWRGWVPRHLQMRLWTIFGAGAALGAVGWWMVSSGLAGSDRVNVSQYRLAFHLTLACAVYASIVWTACELVRRNVQAVSARMRGAAVALMALMLMQIYLGALVAGSGAGHAYDTWPTIDGAFVPAMSSLFHYEPAWRNLFENTLTIQFEHRMLAYAIWILAAWHAADAWRSGTSRGTALVVAAMVTAQAALGIATLLAGDPLALALTHQVFAVFVFTTAIVHAQRVWQNGRVPVAHAPAAEQPA